MTTPAAPVATERLKRRELLARLTDRGLTSNKMEVWLRGYAPGGVAPHELMVDGPIPGGTKRYPLDAWLRALDAEEAARVPGAVSISDLLEHFPCLTRSMAKQWARLGAHG